MASRRSVAFSPVAALLSPPVSHSDIMDINRKALLLQGAISPTGEAPSQADVEVCGERTENDS